MDSKDDIITAVEALDAAYQRLLDLPLNSLTRTDQQTLLRQIDRLNNRLPGLRRQVLGRMIAEAGIYSA